MKKLLYILIFFFSAQAGIGQTIQYLGGPTTQIYVRGQLRIDTIVYLPITDTLIVPSQRGAVVYKSSNNTLYVWDGAKWNRIAVGSTLWGSITGSISSQTDLINLLATYQPLLTQGYGLKITGSTIKFDSAVVRKVDTLYRLNDSTIFYTINGASRTVLIRGTSAGGISSLSLALPNILFNSPVVFSNTAGAWTGTATIPDQNPNYFFAGPSIGSAGQPSFRAMSTSDLPIGIPNANLQNSTINFTIGTSGTAPNWSTGSTVLGGTASLNIPSVNLLNTGIVGPALYTYWNSKVDSTIQSNDTVYEWRNGVRFFRYMIVGSQTLQQVLARGRTLATNDSVLEANNTLYFKGGRTKADQFQLPFTDSNMSMGVIRLDTSVVLSFYDPSQPGNNLFLGLNSGSRHIPTSNVGSAGSLNIGVGANSFQNITTAHENTSVGNENLQFCTTCLGNAMFGETAGKLFTTAVDNTAVGVHAMNLATTASSNTAIGKRCLENLTTGNSNTAVGWEAMDAATIATFNVAVGQGALASVINGGDNVAIGSNSLNAAVSSYNVSVGTHSLAYITDGNKNVAVGEEAGSTVNSLHDVSTYYVGFSARRDPALGSGVALNNAGAIGYNAIVGQSNSLVLGGTGADAINVGIGTSTPSVTAILDLTSTTRGFLPPRMTLANFAAIPPAISLHACLTDSGGRLALWTGSKTITYATTDMLPSNNTLVAEANLTAQTAATSITSYAAPADGTYRIGGYITITAISLDVIQLQVTWTDETNTSRTQVFYPLGATTPGLSITGATGYPTVDIRVKSGATITVSTVLTTGGGSITYDAGGSIIKVK